MSMSPDAPLGPPRAQLLSPSQLNRLARSLLEDAFAQIWVEGEIGNYTRAASGHWYFTLKDSQAQIRCAMFRSQNLYVRSKPAEGMKVLVRGRVSLYEARGEYQLLCEHMEDAGLGQWLRVFEETKARLVVEGLTEATRKRALPAWPRRIAVLTSPQGAALHDVLAVLARRWPLLAVDVYPSQVQGAEAPAQLRAALAAAQAHVPAYDLLLLTRGGGSIEDLWAFNDEPLARAIAASTLPCVSAVGHEVDTTIADLVADLRAPTPSAAAELISPDQQRVRARLDQARDALLAAMQRRLREAQQAIDGRERLLRAHHPRRPLERARERLQQLARRSGNALLQLSRGRRQGLLLLVARLRQQAPAVRIARARSSADAWRQRMLASLPPFPLWRQRLASASHSLQALGPTATLQRGFVLLRDARNHQLLTRASQVEPGMPVLAQFADGSRVLRVMVEAKIEGTDSEGTRARGQDSEGTRARGQDSEGTRARGHEGT